MGFDGFPDAHPSDQAGQLNLLRKLIKACSADPGHLSEFDRIRQAIARITSIRNDLVHGALGLGNNTGTDEGLYVFCAPHRKARRSDSGILPAYHELQSYLVREIFEAADDIWSSRESLDKLVRVVLDN